MEGYNLTAEVSGAALVVVGVLVVAVVVLVVGAVLHVVGGWAGIRGKKLRLLPQRI